MMASDSPFANVWARFSAYWVDRFFVYGIARLGGYLGILLSNALLPSALAATYTEAPSTSDTALYVGFAFWGFAAWFLNYAILQGMTGATLGKHLFKLRVVKVDGAPLSIGNSIGRTLCYWVSAMPLFLGFLSILWNERKQGWHDLICSTVVLKKQAAYPKTEILEFRRPQALDRSA